MTETTGKEKDEGVAQDIEQGAQSEESGAVGSSANTNVAEEVDCRICLLSDERKKLISPCACEGTLQHCHYKCLEQWAKESRSLKCEICNHCYKQPFNGRLKKAISEAEATGRDRNEQVAEIVNIDLSHVQWQCEQSGVAQTRRLWCRMILLAILTVVLLYVIMVISGGHKYSFWMIMILRVLSFVLPFYLVGKAIIALRRYRQDREFAYN